MANKTGRQKRKAARTKRKRKQPAEKTNITTSAIPVKTNAVENRQKKEADNHSQPKEATGKKQSPRRSHPYLMSGFIAFLFIAAFTVPFGIAATVWAKQGYQNIKLALWWGIIGYLMLGVALVFGYYYYVIKPVKQTQTEDANASAHPVLQRPTFQPRADRISIVAGTVAVVYSVAALERRPETPFNFQDNRPVRVYVENKTLYVDASVFIPETREHFEIKRNNYGGIPSGCDLNATPTAIEIVDSNKVPIFQIVFQGESKVTIKGIFVGPNSTGAIIVDDSGVHSSDFPYNIKRIFRYPSYQHPGEYEQTQ